MAKRKILIDCDPGHDDAVALLFAARHLDLVGVTTVHGNNGLENTTRNALAVLELGGIEVPLARGCAEPLATPNVGTAEVHGSTGLDGITLPEPSRRPIDTRAVDFIIEMASRHRGELVLATIGPETNIALALRREPRLKHWLAEIAVMGGSTGNGNVTAAAEWNIHCDSEAAWVVFTSGIPIRMVGLNITRRTGLEQTDIDRLRGSGRKVAEVIADLRRHRRSSRRCGICVHRHERDHHHRGCHLPRGVRPSYWHEFSGDPRTSFSSETGFIPFRADLGEAWVELNAGISARVDRFTELYANANYQFGVEGDSDGWGGKVGLRVNW